MPGADLDDRLRGAFSLPTEPAADRVVAGVIARRLPARRARRGATSGGLGALALGIIALTVGLLVGVGQAGSRPTLAAQPPLGASRADRSCVVVQLGSGPGHCVGTIVSPQGDAAANTPFAPAAPSLRSAGTGSATPGAPSTIGVRAGETVWLSLPKATGVTWSRVTVRSLAPSAVGVRPLALKTGVNRSTGRTLARVPRRGSGRYLVVATGSSCAHGASCTTDAQWSVTLDVR